MAVPPPPVPDLDWPPERARALGERVVDLWAELLTVLPDLPVEPGVPVEEVRAAVASASPEQPLSDDELIGYLRTLVFEHSTFVGHPAFLAYIVGAGTVPGAAADLLAAALNANVAGWRLGPAAAEVELRLVRWLADRFGLPASAGGLIVSGGAMASFVALKLARDAAAPEVRREGVRGLPPLTLYASGEAHVVMDRAADMLGLGTAAVRHIAVDEGRRMRPDALRAAIEADLAAGARPCAVVATAGTTATGAIDPLPAIADIAAEHGVWLHVDAAYGGGVVLVPEHRALLAGVERADSIAFDPHKWLYTPLSGGCVLVREEQRLDDAFAAEASYTFEDKALSRRGPDLRQRGPQFSRGFAALKIWVSLLAHGEDAYARRIAHDCALARYLGELVVERPEFESMAPVGLSICCFRYVPEQLRGHPEVDEAHVDLVNERLLTAIQLGGRSYCSNAILDGRFGLRACIVNFRTEARDLETLLDVAAEEGARLDGELRAGAGAQASRST